KEDTSAAPSIKFVSIPKSLNIKPVGTSPYPEIRIATGLLHFLWSQPMKQGPTSESYAAFIKHPLDVKLEKVRKGKFAIMCQGMRDLFLHASKGTPGLKARG